MVQEKVIQNLHLSLDQAQNFWILKIHHYAKCHESPLTSLHFANKQTSFSLTGGGLNAQK